MNEKEEIFELLEKCQRQIVELEEKLNEKNIPAQNELLNDNLDFNFENFLNIKFKNNKSFLIDNLKINEKDFIDFMNGNNINNIVHILLNQREELNIKCDKSNRNKIFIKIDGKFKVMDFKILEKIIKTISNKLIIHLNKINNIEKYMINLRKILDLNENSNIKKINNKLFKEYISLL